MSGKNYKVLIFTIVSGGITLMRERGTVMIFRSRPPWNWIVQSEWRKM